MAGRSRVVLSLAGAVLLLGPVSVHALDFTLYSTTMEEDGLRVERSYFLRDPATPTNIDVPRGWGITSDQRSITAIPRAISGCQMSVEKSKFAPDMPFKEQGLETYRRYVMSLVPQGAVDVQAAAPKEGALNLFDWKDIEFVVTYDLFGQAFKRGTVFVNLNAKDQVVVTSLAPTANFDMVHAAAVDTMRSWYPLKAKMK